MQRAIPSSCDLGLKMLHPQCSIYHGLSHTLIPSNPLHHNPALSALAHLLLFRCPDSPRVPQNSAYCPSPQFCNLGPCYHLFHPLQTLLLDPPLEATLAVASPCCLCAPHRRSTNSGVPPLTSSPQPFSAPLLAGLPWEVYPPAADPP